MADIASHASSPKFASAAAPAAVLRGYAVLPRIADRGER
jgi:hypothetical protein